MSISYPEKARTLRNIAAMVACTAAEGDIVQTLGYTADGVGAGTYRAGSMIYNTSPSGGGFVGWSCVTGGNPGTWKPFGQISL